jgi:hypothetical protein
VFSIISQVQKNPALKVITRDKDTEQYLVCRRHLDGTCPYRQHVWAFAQFILSWSLHQAQIAGIALSTTSVAVVNAVMIETGHSPTALGKMILAACFITDFGTILALGVLFASFNWWMLLFVGGPAGLSCRPGCGRRLHAR